MTSIDERVSRLEPQVAQLLDAVVDRDAKIAERDAKIAERDAEIAKLKTSVEELEAQAGQNSTDSHKPPSSDPPGTRPPKRGTGRQHGAQRGHKASKRVLLPAERVTRRTDVKPKRRDRAVGARCPITS